MYLPACRQNLPIQRLALTPGSNGLCFREGHDCKKNAPARAGALKPVLSFCCLTAITDEAQQEQEQVDEVEIERQCAHHRLAP